MKKNKGFSLIELILVLGISSLAFIGFIKMEQKKAEINRASIAGEQIREVGEALEVYIARNYATIVGAIPDGTTSANLPITVLTGTTFGAFPGTGVLPAGYINKNIIGGAYDIRIRNESGTLIGMVITTNPVTNNDGTANVRYDLAGAAMKKAGAKSAVAFFFNNQVSGFDGAWTLTQTQFPSILAAGQLAYRAQSLNAATFDNVYLRLDGANQMGGNLNMGNFSVNNVTDINFNGWLNGNNVLVNTIKSGSINNTGNITNAGNINNTGLVSTAKVQINDTVTVDTACPVIGQVAKDINGQVMSCQTGGLWLGSGVNIKLNDNLYGPIGSIAAYNGTDGSGIVYHNF